MNSSLWNQNCNFTFFDRKNTWKNPPQKTLSFYIENLWTEKFYKMTAFLQCIIPLFHQQSVKPFFLKLYMQIKWFKVTFLSHLFVSEYSTILRTLFSITRRLTFILAHCSGHGLSLASWPWNIDPDPLEETCVQVRCDRQPCLSASSQCKAVSPLYAVKLKC